MKLFTHCNKSRQSRTACSYFCRCLQFKLERRSEHAIQFYKLSVTFKRPVFDTWTMLRNWVHRGSPWTGYKEVVHRPGPKGWSMDRVQRGGPWTWGPCFVYVPLIAIVALYTRMLFFPVWFCRNIFYGCNLYQTSREWIRKNWQVFKLMLTHWSEEFFAVLSVSIEEQQKAKYFSSNNPAVSYTQLLTERRGILYCLLTLFAQ